MSGKRRKRESLAPSLFPFLAVLLCTMGSLVLILMLIVSGAQADAERITTQVQERQEEAISLAEHAVASYRKQLDNRRLELEKKRLKLQHFEEHILELTTELEKLRDRHQQLASDETSLGDQEQQTDKISELERQLAEAEEQLKDLEKKPKGEKPIFAVIPYQGPNSTHRRPIYLECTAEGVRLQPEGNLLTLQDLKPPYGPGNPLDAALRAVRAEYKPANGAITRTAYPLLLVRPSGIEAYALARSAMSGWDDQFGYELVEEELDLAFPPGKSGLDQKIEQAVALARERQTALAMAMPRKYQFDVDDLRPLSGGGDGNGSYPASSSRGSFGPQDNTGSSIRSSYDSDQQPTSSSEFGNRATKGSAGSLSAGSSRQSSGDALAGSFAGGGGHAAQSALGTGSAEQRTNTAGTQTNSTSSDSNSDLGSQAGQPTLSATSPGNTPGPSSAGKTASNQFGPADNQQGGSRSDAGPAGDPTAGLSSSSLSSRTRPLKGASGSSSGDSSTTAGSQSGQSYPGQSSSMAMQSAAGAPSQTDPNANEAQAVPQLSMNMDFSRQETEARPVAARRGRDWAWSDGPRSQTPIVRPIYLRCYGDRWVVMPDGNASGQQLVIPFEGTPEERAGKLAKAVQDRVEGWGFALAGGYWKPELVVDVASDANWRFQQLVQLFDGSGLEIRRRTRTANRSEAR